MPIRPTKNAHPTATKNMTIRPTKSAHLTYNIEWPSDMLQLIISTLLRYKAWQKLLNRSDGQEDMPIRPTAFVGQMLQ